MHRRRNIQGINWIGFINVWVIGGAVLFACLLLIFTISLIWFSRPKSSLSGAATAILYVIEAPTITPSPAISPTSANPTQTSQLPPSPPPGVIAIGAYVQITGTGNDGLRLRDEPGLDASVHILGSEAEVFRVEDGPREIDGYTWWYLVGPFDSTRFGWGVSNYLSIVQNP